MISISEDGIPVNEFLFEWGLLLFRLFLDDLHADLVGSMVDVEHGDDALHLEMGTVLTQRGEMVELNGQADGTGFGESVGA